MIISILFSIAKSSAVRETTAILTIAFVNLVHWIEQDTKQAKIDAKFLENDISEVF